MLKSTVYSIITVPVFAVLYTFTFMATLTAIVFAHLNFKKALTMNISIWGKGLFWLMGKRLQISGLDLIDKQKKYVLVANHCSLFDIPAIMSFFPRVSWFGRERLVKIPVFGQLLKAIDYVPMRSTGIKNTREMLSKLINKAAGFTVAMFPEGTRTVTGELGRFRKGFLHILRGGEMDLLPVTLNGFFQFKSKDRFYINFDTKLKIIVHKPISKEALVCMDDNEIVSQTRDLIESGLRN